MRSGRLVAAAPSGLVIRALVDSQVQVQGAFFSHYDFRFHKLALVFVQLVHWLDEQVLVDLLLANFQDLALFYSYDRILDMFGFFSLLAQRIQEIAAYTSL